MALCDVFWVMHVDESDLVQRPEGHGGYFPTEKQGYPDITRHPRPVDSTPRALARGLALLLGDWHLPHGGGPVPIAPRQLAQGRRRARARMGFEAYSALELEFYLFDEPPGMEHRKRPAELVTLQQQPSTYGVVLGSHQERICSVIRQSMLDFGLPIEACNPETGPGQFEINLRYAEPALGRRRVLLQVRGEGGRRPARLPGDVHGQAQPRVGWEQLPHRTSACATSRAAGSL